MDLGVARGQLDPGPAEVVGPEHLRFDVGLRGCAGDPCRPPEARRVGDVGVEPDRPPRGAQGQPGVAHQAVVAVSIERGGSQEPGVPGSGGRDRLDDRLEPGLAVAVLAVEEPEVLGLPTHEGEGGTVLLVALAHAAHRVLGAGQAIPPGVAPVSVRRAAEDVEHPHRLGAREQVPEREHGVVGVGREDDRGAHASVGR